MVLTEDGTDTLEILGRFVVDAVILDEHMPRCCGLDAAKYIKRQHPDLPIILFTADDYYEQYKSPSIDAAVIKSEDLGMLKETISKLLNPGKKYSAGNTYNAPFLVDACGSGVWSLVPRGRAPGSPQPIAGVIGYLEPAPRDILVFLFSSQFHARPVTESLARGAVVSPANMDRAGRRSADATQFLVKRRGGDLGATR